MVAVHGLFGGHPRRHGGGGGVAYGRVYRNREEFRRDYRERANVGGFLGSILDSNEFEIFLALLVVLICLNAFRTFSTAPITSCTVWISSLLYFQNLLGFNLLSNETFNNYTFHPQRVVQEGQYYRALTAPFLHKGRRLIFYLNMSALSAMSPHETRLLQRQGHSMEIALVFVAALMVVTGGIYTALCHMYKPTALNTYACGSMALLFAFKAFVNSSAHGAMRDYQFPVLGQFYAVDIPIEVPCFATHFVELFLLTIFFQTDVNWYWNLAGVLAGHVVYAVSVTGQALLQTVAGRSLTTVVTENSTSIQTRMMGLLMVVTAYLAYKVVLDQVTQHLPNQQGQPKSNYSRPPPLQRSPYAKKSSSTTSKSKTNKASTRKFTFPSSSASVPQEVMAKWQSGTTSSQGNYSGNHNSPADEDSLLYDNESNEDLSQDGASSTANGKGSSVDDYSVVTGGNADDTKTLELMDALPEQVSAALTLLTTESLEKTAEQIIYAADTIQEMFHNAITKGQKDDKYRRIATDKKRIVKCQKIEGSLELVLSLGFETKEDFDGRLFLVYPNDLEIPVWAPDAIAALARASANLKALSDAGSLYSAKSVRAARLQKLDNKKKAKRKPRESSFTPSLGGGNRDAVFYRGGT